VLRLDGSGLLPYSNLLASAQSDGFMKRLLSSTLGLGPGIAFAAALSLLLLLATFGAWTIVYPAVLSRLKARSGMPAALFPALVALNYLVMSTGLAMDSRRIGQPEELLHRPFVWAYFVVCAWAGAGLYLMAFGGDAPRPGRSRILAALVVILALVGALHFGRDIQSLRAWFPKADGTHVATCLVRVARHVRETGDATDLIQSSDNDPRAQMSGLSQRQAFAIDAANRMGMSPAKARRLEELARLKEMEREETALDYLRRNRIRWYVLAPGDRTRWPASMDRYEEFRCEGYRVYRFADT
jgi:hypothetical protein